MCLPRKRTSLLIPQDTPLTVLNLDILNQLNPSGPKPKADPEKLVDPGPHSQLENARHFVKFVFPRQHGLPNPFTMSIENAVPSYNREIEAAISVSTGVILCRVPN